MRSTVEGPIINGRRWPQSTYKDDPDDERQLLQVADLGDRVRKKEAADDLPDDNDPGYGYGEPLKTEEDEFAKRRRVVELIP
jgi:hypothetical protein